MSDDKTSGDSSELEALFDSIASGVVSTPPVATVAAVAREERDAMVADATGHDGVGAHPSIVGSHPRAPTPDARHPP